MSPIRQIALVVGLVGASAFCATTDTWAQQKRTLAFTRSASETRYLQEHAIDVGDVPGHQVRVYELYYEYPKKELVFDGVAVKESWNPRSPSSSGFPRVRNPAEPAKE